MDELDAQSKQFSLIGVGIAASFHPNTWEISYERRLHINSWDVRLKMNCGNPS